MPAVPPIRRELIVAADPQLAFDVFTGEMGSWWPFGEHSVHGEGSTVAFRDGLLIESRTDADDTAWATVTAWDPPREFALDWYPGRTADRASRVWVRFEPAGAGRTLVRLEHDGWDIYDDPAAARADYDLGWPVVLGRYEDAVYRDHGTWVALLHTATAQGHDVFADPRFGRHAEFLERMREAGWLVAAGPLGDEAGAGMTVLRLPGADRWEDAERAATSDDAGVTSGLLAVRVRPWQVMRTG